MVTVRGGAGVGGGAVMVARRRRRGRDCRGASRPPVRPVGRRGGGGRCPPVRARGRRRRRSARPREPDALAGERPGREGDDRREGDARRGEDGDRGGAAPARTAAPGPRGGSLVGGRHRAGRGARRDGAAAEADARVRAPVGAVGERDGGRPLGRQLARDREPEAAARRARRGRRCRGGSARRRRPPRPARAPARRRGRRRPCRAATSRTVLPGGE